MVKIESNKRICACGKTIKNDTESICISCQASYKHLRNHFNNDLNTTIDEFIQYIKYECGYSLHKPKDIE